MTRVFLSLGTNYQRQENISQALMQLQQFFSPLDLSAVYESEAIDGGRSQYFNLCLGFDTSLSLAQVRQTIQAIERQQGRNRDHPSRVTIDIDLLLYGDCVERSADFVLPHPDITRYPHILIPLLDIAPDLTLPGSGQALRDYSDNLPAENNLRRVDLVPVSD